MIVSCPDCRESVRLDGNLPGESVLRCPWCRSTYTVDSILKQIPTFEIVSGPAVSVQTSPLPVHSNVTAGAAAPLVADATGSLWQDASDETLIEDSIEASISDSSVSPGANASAPQTEEGLLEPDELTDWDTISNEDELKTETVAEEEISLEPEWAPAQEWKPSGSPDDETFQSSEQPIRRRRAASPSPIKTIVQVVAGGVGGLLGAGAILWYLGKLPPQVANLLSSGNANNVASGTVNTPAKVEPTTLKMPDFSSIPVPSLDAEKEQQNSRQMQDLGSGDLPSANDKDSNEDPATSKSSDTPANTPAPETGDSQPSEPGPATQTVSPSEKSKPKDDLDISKQLPGINDLLKPSGSEALASEPLSLDARTKHAAATQAFIQLIEKPGDKGRIGQLFVSLVGLATSLPEGIQFPKEVNGLIEGVAAQKDFNSEVAKVLQRWWKETSVRKGANGIYAVGALADDGKAIDIEGGLKLPLKVDSIPYAKGQQLLILGKIEGEGSSQIVVPAGIYPLPKPGEEEPLR